MLTLKFRISCLFLMLLCVCTLNARAEETDALSVVEAKAYQVWRMVNEARANPAAVAARLGIGREAAALALGDEAWVLDQGLPPLAWDDQLVAAASAHGRDILTRVYYSHVSPEGWTPADRIAATGYLSSVENEALSAMVFSNPIPVDEAVGIMVDTLMYDELTGQGEGARKIFSPAYTELGLSFNAETVPNLGGQPFVYLIVAEFASPLQERFFLMGPIDPQTRMVSFSQSTAMWREARILPGEYYQIQLGEEDARFYYWNTLNVDQFFTISRDELREGSNNLVDLRQQ